MPISRRDFLLATAAVALEASCSSIQEPVCWLQQHGACPAPNPVPVDLPADRCELFAFDEIHRATPTIYRPQSEGDLARLLPKIPEGRRVTFRGGGQALDDQSLNDDLVVLMDAPGFSDIGYPQQDENGFYYLKTGAGARWGKVLQKIAPLGLVPRSLATAQFATVGGTLSADCVSRQSPIMGKEGAQIRAFTIVLADGRVLEVQKSDGKLANPRDERRLLWEAVIGGFGYLGAVTSVTFDLMVARSRPLVCGQNPSVFTRSTRHGANVDWDAILRALHFKTRNAQELHKRRERLHFSTSEKEKVPLASAPEWSALSIASFFEGNGMSANLLEQRFVEGVPLRPFPGGIYEATAAFPANAEALTSRWPTIAELGVQMGFAEGEFVDELFGWSFFLGNSTFMAKQMLHATGERLNFTQQSFALPSGTKDQPDTAPTRRFVELVQARLHAADIRPADIDFLWIPADEFLMSASRGLSGYVVTLAFADRNRQKLSPEVDETLRALAHDCRTLGGRIHLVKNVVADESDLRAMHGDAARELQDRKRVFDPKGILRNDFFRRVFDA
jgi:FAD/FMN-containing dehydrogenase